MSELTDTLVRCFAAVFPELPPERIPEATVDSVEEWDSLASVTLVAVLEEELGVEVDLADLPQLRSFEAVHDYVLARDRGHR